MTRHILVLRGVLLIVAGVVLLFSIAAGGDLWPPPVSLGLGLRDVVGRYGYLGGFLLIYAEESGVPLFVPGDVFLVYVGHRLPSNFWVWLAAWSGFVTVVVLGSMNLYLLSRRVGRRVIAHPVGRFLHLTPDRLARAEAGFRRWGPWAVIVGRHVPGLRVPITVAAGILGMELRTFLVCVGISSAIWAAIFLALGIAYGESIARLLHTPVVYAFPPLILGLVAGWLFRRQLIRLTCQAARRAYPFWRPQHFAVGGWNVGVAFVCGVSLLGVFAAEYLTATAYVAIGAAVPVVTAAWLLSGRSAVVVAVFACVLALALYLIGSLDVVSMSVEIAGLAALGTMVGLAANLGLARSEGHELKGDLEDHDRRLRFLEAITLDMINTLSHELRTPLGVVRGYVSMLEDGTIDSGRYPTVSPILSQKLREINDLIERSLAEYAQITVAAARRRDIPESQSSETERGHTGISPHS